MTNHHEISAVGQLILVRLLTGGDKGATLTQVKKDVEPLLQHRWTGASLTDLLDTTFAQLGSAGLLNRTRKGKTDRGTLTEAGRRHALEFLGIDDLPARSTWTTLKKTYLLARVLGLPAPRGEGVKRFSSDPGFKAALLRSTHALPLDSFPTLAQATDALAWKLFGVDSTRPFTKDAALNELFNRPLGEHRQSDHKKALVKLVSKAANARNDKPGELREAVIRGWVDRGAQAAAPTSAARPFDLTEFARRVVSAARSVPTGRFGENKVFIAHVWRALRGAPDLDGWAFPEFAQKLIEANHARLLDLSRADLVEAMDPEDVRESEVRHLGASFHFVRI
jgi:hypothetical protein